MSGKRKLASYVHVSDGENYGVFGPDDEVPAWAAKAITNPSAWDDAAAEDFSAKESNANELKPPKK